MQQWIVIFLVLSVVAGVVAFADQFAMAGLAADAAFLVAVFCFLFSAILTAEQHLSQVTSSDNLW